jgi:phosphotriesterase-related protein
MIVTVDDPIQPDDLGVTITHEHTFIDLRNWVEFPENAYQKGLASQSVSMDNLWYARRHRIEDNYELFDADVAEKEISRYLEAGGDTIVDVTPKGTGPAPKQIRQMARKTGVQYVHGTAYYVRSSHPSSYDDMSEEAVEQEFVDDVTNGIGETDVRAGIIGEIGLSATDGDIHPQEMKSLRAGARAALRTGASLSIHPPGRTKPSQRGRTYPTSRWALEVLDIVESEGLDPERVVMCHMDRSFYEDLEYQKQLAERGAYLEYDLFGTDGIYFTSADDGYPSDIWRIRSIDELVQEGYGSQILVSQDVCKKTQLATYGGFGYDHILTSVVPMFHEHSDLEQDDIDRLLMENPKRALTFVEAE